jgi:hypothetical protein
MEFTSFKGAADALADDLKKQYRDRLPNASVQALTKTSVIARDAIKGDMKRVFKSPTPYALNASRALFARKATMSSAVLLRDFGKLPAEDYLGPEIEGGDRKAKNFEKALRDAGILPVGMFVVPGRAATIDRYGNQSAAEIVAILAAMSAYRSGGAVARAVTKRALARRARPRIKYFVARSSHGSGKPLGIYKVVSAGKVVPVMIFTKTPHYTARFDFYQLARGHAQKAFPAALDAALGTA